MGKGAQDGTMLYLCTDVGGHIQWVILGQRVIVTRGCGGRSLKSEVTTRSRCTLFGGGVVMTGGWGELWWHDEVGEGPAKPCPYTC